METAGMSTIRGRQIKINPMSPWDEDLSASQLDSTYCKDDQAPDVRPGRLRLLRKHVLLAS